MVWIFLSYSDAVLTVYIWFSKSFFFEGKILKVSLCFVFIIKFKAVVLQTLLKVMFYAWFYLENLSFCHFFAQDLWICFWLPLYSPILKMQCVTWSIRSLYQQTGSPLTTFFSTSQAWFRWRWCLFGYGSKKNPWGPQVLVYFSFTNRIFRYLFFTHSHLFLC